LEAQVTKLEQEKKAHLDLIRDLRTQLESEQEKFQGAYREKGELRSAVKDLRDMSTATSITESEYCRRIAAGIENPTLKDRLREQPTSPAIEAVIALRDERDQWRARCSRATDCKSTSDAPGAFLLPGGKRIVLAHIETYELGGDTGIVFQMSSGQKIAWSPPTGPINFKELGWVPRPGSIPTRAQLQEEVVAVLDGLFNFGSC
jgi:hypothetical protein